MAIMANLRLVNLLASTTLNLAEECRTVLEETAGLSGAATEALLALDEFLEDAHVGRLAEVLGLTHSGAVRLVTQLEREQLAKRRAGVDRRRVEVRLTVRGRDRVRAARKARDELLHQALSGLDTEDATTLEELLAKVVAARVEGRVEGRRAGHSSAWWCRTCDFAACGRPEGRCPAQLAAGQIAPTATETLTDSSGPSEATT